MSANLANLSSNAALRLDRGVAFASPLAKTAVVAYAALLAWLIWPTLLDLSRLWTASYTYSYGYLVALLTVVLVVRAARRERFGPLLPSVFGSLALAGAIALLLAGRASETRLAGHVALPAVLLAACWAIAGWRNTQRFVWPLAYLYFAVSFWDVLIPLLQSLTSSVASGWVRSVGVAAFLDGNWIRIPSGTLKIAGGCSGLNFLMVGLASSAYYGLSYYGSWLQRIALVLVAAALALVANWVRVFLIVMIGYATEMQSYLVRVDHYYFGWAVFAVALVPIFWVARGIERWNPDDTDLGTRANRAARAGQRPSWLEIAPPRPRRVVGVVAFAVVAAGAWLAYRVDAPRAASLEPEALTVDPSPAGWQREGTWADARRPVFIGTSAETAAWYRRDADRIGVYVARYAQQSQGREIVYYANRPQGASAEILARARQAVSAPDERVEFQESEVSDGMRGRRLVWFAMRVAGQWASQGLQAKLYQVLGAFTGRRDAEALVLTATCAANCAHARTLLASGASAAITNLATGGASLRGKAELGTVLSSINPKEAKSK